VSGKIMRISHNDGDEHLPPVPAAGSPTPVLLDQIAKE